MRQQDDLQRLADDALKVIRRVNGGRLSDTEAKALAKVFSTERLCFQYFEDGYYDSAVRHLARQGHPVQAGYVRRFL